MQPFKSKSDMDIIQHKNAKCRKMFPSLEHLDCVCVCVCEQRCYEARSSNTIFSLASTQHFRHIGGFAFYVCCRRAHRMFYWTGLLILSVLIFRKMLNETCIAHSMTEHRFSKFHLNRFFVRYEAQPQPYQRYTAG